MFTIISKYLPGKVVQGLTAAYFRVSALGHRQFGGAHSFAEQILFDNMEVKILPALSDNYMYLVIDKNTNQAAIVDPVNPGLVLEAVEQANVNLTKVLTTHHHWDHAGGNEELVKKCRNTLKVYGGDKRIGALTHYVGDGDVFSIGNINVQCIFTPCHTTGHICFYLTIADQTPIVFTGDTLFIAGCGRFFEGTAEQMYEALIEKLGNLPDETRVFCGHEYTVQNLKYALQVEPDNPDILKKMQWANSRRCSGQPTVPSTIMEEKLINPFMRVTNRSVQEYAGCSDPIATMKKIRTEKDSFK